MPLRGKKSGSLAKVGVDEKQSPMPEDSTIELVVKSPQQTPMPFVETLDETNESLSKTGKVSVS